MKTNFTSFLIFAFAVLILANCRSVTVNVTTSKHDLLFSKLASSWDEAIPLGKGMLGALVWQKGDNLRISLDRADLWDLRPMDNMGKPEFSFKWVQEQVKNKNYKVVHEMFDVPYDRLPAPSKIQGAALEFDTKELGKVLSVRLLINNALCETKWANGASLQTFVSADQPSGWFRFEGVPENFVPVLMPPQYQKEEVSGIINQVTG